MPGRLPRRLPATLRIAALLLFALGLVVQPALGAWGEIHELAEHAGSADPHGSDHVPHAHDAPATDAGDRDAGDPVDLLLHFTHCCGYPVALGAMEPSLLTVRFAPVRLPLGAAPSVATSRATTPFRPPIPA